jgi:hypothetical protein
MRQPSLVWLLLGLGVLLMVANVIYHLHKSVDEEAPIVDTFTVPIHDHSLVGDFSCISENPLIHFPLSVTSRNLRESIARFDLLPLFQFALPSVIATVEPDRFRYAIAIAADMGDPWYDNIGNQHVMQEWWHTHWTTHWPTACQVPFTFHIYANTRSRNTWAVNYATQRGYEEGADFFYRINDDTVLYANNWSSVFVAELAAMRPIPYLGVTGPADPYQNNEVLTHSFISRRHYEFYGTHFPFLLGNWWTDPWIQQLYAPPYPASFGKDARLMSIVANVSIEHKVLPARYDIKSTETQYLKQLAIDRDELELYVTGLLKKKKNKKRR